MWGDGVMARRTEGADKQDPAHAHPEPHPSLEEPMKVESVCETRLGTHHCVSDISPHNRHSLRWTFTVDSSQALTRTLVPGVLHGSSSACLSPACTLGRRSPEYSEESKRSGWYCHDTKSWDVKWPAGPLEDVRCATHTSIRPLVPLPPEANSGGVVSRRSQCRGW